MVVKYVREHEENELMSASESTGDGGISYTLSEDISYPDYKDGKESYGLTIRIGVSHYGTGCSFTLPATEVTPTILRRLADEIEARAARRVASLMTVYERHGKSEQYYLDGPSLYIKEEQGERQALHWNWRTQELEPVIYGSGSCGGDAGSDVESGAGADEEYVEDLGEKAEDNECPHGGCTNVKQCWEPCGELGHSAEHARRVDPEIENAIQAALKKSS